MAKNTMTRTFTTFRDPSDGSRDGAYLRKMLHKPEIIETKLMSWWLNYCAMNEDGKWLCNKATEPAIHNQMGHTQDILGEGSG
jgi:hypothetical protein